jgi:DNA-binding response OmpR family regulator
MRALVVEDNESVAKLIARSLQPEGFRVDVAGTVRDADRFLLANDYGLIVLDMVLPDGQGMELLKIIRARGTATPVLIASGEGDVDTIVRGLDAGADDYLQKPFQAEELRARVRALRRRGPLDGSPAIACGNLRLDRMRRQASVEGARMNLTAKEYALLEYLATNSGKKLTRKDLLEKVWRFDFDPGTNMVDVSVSRLRAKLVELGATWRVDAERGVGYIFHEG